MFEWKTNYGSRKLDAQIKHGYDVVIACQDWSNSWINIGVFILGIYVKIVSFFTNY